MSTIETKIFLNFKRVIFLILLYLVNILMYMSLVYCIEYFHLIDIKPYSYYFIYDSFWENIGMNAMLISLLGFPFFLPWVLVVFFTLRKGLALAKSYLLIYTIGLVIYLPYWLSHEFEMLILVEGIIVIAVLSILNLAVYRFFKRRYAI